MIPLDSIPSLRGDFSRNDPILYRFESGEIKINGEDIGRFDTGNLRSRLALVTQDPFLFSGTIRENITHGGSGLMERDFERILNYSNCKSFVDRLPHGLDTELSEGGSSLSSGERQLLSIAMLSAALNQDKDQWDVIDRIPSWVEETLQMNAQIERLAERYAFMNQCVVLGRGFNYATAFEWSLKMKELSYVVTEPYSSADFQHGPIAIVEHRFPIFAVMPQGAVYQDLLQLLRRLLDQQVELVVVSNQEEALQLANTPLSIPGTPEWISPVVSIIPAQMFCYYLTLARGFDPERPRGLRKVTETQ